MKNPHHGWTRRDFFRTLGASVPTLTLLPGAAAAPKGPSSVGAPTSEKFTPIDLGPYFNLSSREFGPREQARAFSSDSLRDGLIRTPAGAQNLHGIPFQLGPEGVEQKSWLLLQAGRSGTGAVEVPIQRRAGFLCVAGFCDWDKNETPPADAGVETLEKIGQRLAEAVLVYEDGRSEALPIRRRFEVNSPTNLWGHLCFAAEPHLNDRPGRLTDPLRNAKSWGRLQTAVWDNHYPDGLIVWISALTNPHPERPIKTLRLLAASDDAAVICGLTLFVGSQNPLRYRRLEVYRLTLPEAVEEHNRWKVEVDLGVVARTYTLGRFDPDAWLASPDAGLGGRDRTVERERHLYAEVTASPEATLWLRDSQTGKDYAFDLGQVVADREAVPRDAGAGGASIEILEPGKVWLHGEVMDASTRKPTPVRLAFRSKEGRYIPPYGHRTEINDAWFEDYGADVKLMDTSFAYVDGTFQVELPPGDVYVEITKGFEYGAVRRRITIEPGQRELRLEISRLADFLPQGWTNADSHVHFLSPTTALLEAQAEDLNLINLLAAQWGDLFTNVGDLSPEPLTTRDGQTMVWVGTENRQHILGHIGMLGTHSPVYPMSASGPEESYLGDLLHRTLADWADACREREGLAVAVHFPYPTAEIAADIVLGKIDAVELWPMMGGDQTAKAHFNNLRYLDWYRYLNCGYRLPAVGGTDKMGAYMPAGTNRGYAYLGDKEFNFANWAGAVRKGNTFVTSGPLLLFQAEGHAPGEEIRLGTGGGMVEIQAKAKSFVPFHRLEVVMNGGVVALREEPSGTREMTLTEKVRVSGPGWLAARCTSHLGPTTNWEFGIQAHTSPVYVLVPGQELFSVPAAAYMLTLIEGAQTWVENLAIRPDAKLFAQARTVFEDARARLHRRMHDQGIPH
jgi:hypothetical protein